MIVFHLQALQLVGTEHPNRTLTSSPGSDQLIPLKYSKCFDLRCAVERNGVLKGVLRKGCHVFEFYLTFRRSGIDGSCGRRMATLREEAGRFGTFT